MHKDLQEAMLRMNSSKEGYMLWLDHSKPDLQSKSLEQYLAVRPMLLPCIPEKYRTIGAANMGNMEPGPIEGLHNSKQAQKAAALDAAVADIATVSLSMIAWAKSGRLQTTEQVVTDVRSIGEATGGFKVI